MRAPEAGTRRRVLRTGGTAAQVAGSQFAVATCYYVLLAVAARHVDTAGFAAVSAYYLLVNAVGRGLFAAVELETTRAVAQAVATGESDRRARRAAWEHTGLLLVVALVLLGAGAPLLARVVGPGWTTAGLLAVGAVGLAASYLLRGPLAGHRRYRAYATTYGAEALATVVGAAALAVLDVTATAAWMAVLALAPLGAALVTGPFVAGRRGARSQPGRVRKATFRTGDGRKVAFLTRGAANAGAAANRGALLWSAALLLAGQGVWNLAPVVLTGRLADAPAVAAGFTTAAVILRAPVLFFPSLQALLLPRFTALASGGDRAGLTRLTRLLVGLLAAGGLVWIAAAVFVVPALARLVFATTVAPPPLLLGLLAVSTVLGAAAQIGQVRMVAQQRAAAAALAWLAGLVVLLAVALLAEPPVVAATAGQLLAAALTLVLLSRRGPR